MIGFFILEKIVNVLGDWRQERDTQKVQVVREGHKINDDMEEENVVCKNKYSNYCASEVSFQSQNVTGSKSLTLNLFLIPSKLRLIMKILIGGIIGQLQ